MSTVCHNGHDTNGVSTSSTSCIYLDYNGTTPIHPEVTDAMIPFLTTHFGNPSSDHAYGKVPRDAVATARHHVVSLLRKKHGHDDRSPSSSSPYSSSDYDRGLIFTGCGTEADNLAVHLAVRLAPRSPRPHVVSTTVEHPAVLECLRSLEAEGAVDVTYLPVDGDCLVTAAMVDEAVQPGRTCLVTVMWAQNEIGSLMPVRDIARVCRKHDGVLFHTDAAQAVGKVDLGFGDDDDDDVMPDMMTLVGHKFGAPKGIAALFLHPSVEERLKNSHSAPFFAWGRSGALLVGGGQEAGRRAGTENVPYIVGMGKAAALVRSTLCDRILHMTRLRARLWQQLQGHLSVEKDPHEGDILRRNGPSDPTRCLPNTLSVGIRGVHSGRLLRELGQDRVAASAGSACHSHATAVSAVLREMKVPPHYALGTLRLSVGAEMTEEEIDEAALRIANEVKKQWAESSDT